LLNGADHPQAARNAQHQPTVANHGDRSTEIMTAAAGMPGEFHAGDLAKLVDGMTVDNIARYLRRFVNSGRLVRTGRGMFRCLTADENVTHLDFGGGADED
jgi:hypothetical protein